MNQTEISIVVPAYNEAGNIHPLYNSLKTILNGKTGLWEIIFIDDGSSDKTWETIQGINSIDSRVRGLSFSRNFGHQYALLAGLGYAVGKAVISMDADLQHPPNVIPVLIDHWRAGCKIVNTIRKDTQSVSWFKRWSSNIFYSMFNYLSGVRLNKGMADFRLLDRSVVQELTKFKEEGLFLRGLVEWIGFEKTSVEYTCGKRFSGKSKYNISRMLRFAWHGVTSFSIVPLRLAIALGILTSILSFSGLSFAFYSKVVSGNVVPGWASTIGVLSFLFGILFILLGIIGEYIGRILEQSRGRPFFIISKTIGMEIHSRNQEKKEDPFSRNS